MIDDICEWTAGVIAVILWAIILGHIYGWAVSTVPASSPWGGVLHSVSEMGAAALALTGGGFVGAVAIALRVFSDSFGGRSTVDGDAAFNFVLSIIVIGLVSCVAILLMAHLETSVIALEPGDDLYMLLSGVF
ncbi:hypothetical protein [Natronobacterium haloterrestre]|uniref:hypothetical protein n=1 Tax=Natronobacterium haloterrestre TaxID=148448 RepID=UPI000B7C57BB|nr:hypothetical protein [Halobiforma haloterrestris]